MVLPWIYWGGVGRGVDALGAPGLPILPPPPPHPLRCLEDCGHGVCSGPPDFTCVCDLGWTSDLPPPTPAPGPPAPRCSRDCGCNFHSHCHKRGPGFCDECQGEQPAASLRHLPGVPESPPPAPGPSVPLPVQRPPSLWDLHFLLSLGTSCPALSQLGSERVGLLPALAPDPASCPPGPPQTGRGGTTVSGAGLAASGTPRAPAAVGPASAMGMGTLAEATVTTSAGSASARTTPRVPTASSAPLATMGTLGEPGASQAGVGAGWG